MGTEVIALLFTTLGVHCEQISENKYLELCLNLLYRHIVEQSSHIIV